MDRKLLITIDTEALPARASDNHVEKLIWGTFGNGRAGIIEICDVIEEFGGKGLFFLDVAGSFNDLAAYREVNSYLERRGHMVEWHYHPEILGREFWKERHVSANSLRQEKYDQADTKVILDAGFEQFRVITGRHPIAYRAGSFRWNGHTLDFLRSNGILFSFNACAETSVKADYDTFCPQSPSPFYWARGLIEVPCGEVIIDGKPEHLRFPRRLRSPLTFTTLAVRIAMQAGGLACLLMHSWSFLERDTTTGFFKYVSARQMDNFRRELKSMSNVFEPAKLEDIKRIIRIKERVIDPTESQYGESDQKQRERGQ